MDTILKTRLLTLLESQYKADRVAGIARAGRFPPEPDMLDALRRLAADGDQDVALFAGMTLSRLAPAGAPVAREAVSLLTRELLAKPAPSDIPVILREFREHSARIPAELRIAVVKILARNGAPDDAERLVAWLDETPDDQAPAYLDALGSLSPQTLLRILPRFLASKLPSMRGRAVSILNRLDPEEALAHLSELLASDERDEQLAGLRIAFQFPYGGLAPPVLNLLAETDDNEIFQASAMFLLSNPDLEIAFRILELQETLAEPRSGLFGKLLHQLLPMLASIRLLDEGEATREGLARKYRKERLRTFLAELEIQISLGEPAKLAAIEAWLAKNLANPEVTAFVGKLAANPATEELHRRLTAGRGPVEKAPPAAPVAPATPAAPAAAAEPSPRQPPRTVELRERSPEEKLAVLKTLSGTNSQEDEAVKALTDMLASEYPLLRARAVNGLMNCPFKRVSETVFSALRVEANPDIAKALLTVILRNPEPSALAELDRLPPSRIPAVAVLVAQYRTLLFRQLLDQGLMPETQPTAAPAPAPSGATVNAPDAQVRTAVPSPAPVTSPTSPKPYSVANIAGTMRQREIEKRRAVLEKKAPSASSAGSRLLPPDFPLAKAVGAAALMGGLAVFILSYGPADSDAIPDAGNLVEGSRQTSNTLKMGMMCRLTGKVTSVKSPRVIGFKVGDRLLRLTFKTKPPTVLGFEEAEVDVLPMIRRKDGEILADCYRFKAK